MKQGVLVSLIALIFLAGTFSLKANKKVYVENDTTKPIAVGLYHYVDKKERKAKAKLLGDPDQGNLLTSSSSKFYIIAPGERAQISHTSDPSTEVLVAAHDIDGFANGLSRGKWWNTILSQPSQDFGFNKDIYVTQFSRGPNNPGATFLQGVKTREEALKASGDIVGAQLTLEKLKEMQQKGVPAVQVMTPKKWEQQKSAQKK